MAKERYMADGFKIFLYRRQTTNKKVCVWRPQQSTGLTSKCHKDTNAATIRPVAIRFIVSHLTVIYS
ncbi:hypothetical protein QTP88_015089 [Uroleucon formosanum]